MLIVSRVAAGAFLWSFQLALFSSVAIAQQHPDDPIAFSGHGAIFDQSGNEIYPSLEFLSVALTYYEAELIRGLPNERVDEYKKIRSGFGDLLDRKDQSALVTKDRLLGWLLENAKVDPNDLILGKIGLVRRYLAHDLSSNNGLIAPLARPPFKLDPDVQARLEKITSTLRLGGNVGVRSVTANGGAAYRQECLNAGVPVPVDFGPGSPWVNQGQIAQNQLFIVSGLQATVLSMQSTSPPGMCVALPRHDASGTVYLDGIICLGQQTSKACFWDNQDLSLPATDPNASFQFQLGSTQPISRWAGGGELRAAIGGVCSDCHAGENPYNIHPNRFGIANNPLGNLAVLGLPTMPMAWHDPFVRAGDTVAWPENPGPMNSPAPCTSCHGDFANPGFAGRLPHVSSDLPGYCGAILRSAVGALAPPPPPMPGQASKINPPATMPANSRAGTLACTPGLLAGDPNFRACSTLTTQDCTPDFYPGNTALGIPPDPRIGLPQYRVSCTSELANLLSWCSTAASGDASGRGDPHVTTFDSVAYDFQSAGEFTYLRGFDGFEVQVRQTPVATAGALPPNPHTGLSSCVSVNTAVAARMGKHRVTYQPDAKAQSEPIIRIDGESRELGPDGIDLGRSGKVTTNPLTKGITMKFVDGTSLTVSTNWWPDQQLWYMNVDATNTRARDGILGAIAPNEWLPNLADGSSLGPLPTAMMQRYFDLNYRFADSWRVTEWTSLFDYENGQTTKDFIVPDWPPATADCKVVPGSSSKASEPMPESAAAEICGKIEDKSVKQQCILDVSITGERGFADVYQASDRLR